VITGATAVGKTDLSLDVALELGCHIVSADSRQFYRELKIGTAPPSQTELEKVPHYFVGHISVFEHYNAALFEQQAIPLIGKLFDKHDYVVVTGGSGLYLDTLCHGIDELPGISPLARRQVHEVYLREGVPGLRRWLKTIDPVYYRQADTANPMRMKRAIEVFLSAGIPFSRLRKSRHKTRPFRICRIVLDRPRQELFARINARTDRMIHDGLIEEGVCWFRFRELNALNTVGYKEIFAWLSNQWPLDVAVEKIRTNSRRYAKRQLTWFRRYADAAWFHPQERDAILEFIRRGT